MSIHIQGVKITGVASYRRYFDVEEVLNLLAEKTQQFRRFYEDSFPQILAAELFGTHSVDGTPKKDALEHLLEYPEDITSLTWYFTKDQNGKEIHINIENLEVGLTKMVNRYKSLAKNLSSDDRRWEAIENGPAAEDMKRSIHDALLNITELYGTALSSQGALYLYVYCLLCIQASIMPGDKLRLEGLNRVMQRLAPVTTSVITTQTHISFHEPLTLPFYEGWENDDGLLCVVELTNESNKVLEVTLDGTTIRRTVEGGGRVFVIRKSGRYVSFLPRVALVMDTVLKIENGRLCTVFQDQVSYLVEQGDVPASYAHSNEYGTFIIDTEGNLNRDLAWPEEYPAEAVVQVSAYGDNYAMLLSDGTVNSRPTVNIKNVIGISVGVNGQAILDSARRLVLQDGSMPHPHAVVSARAVNGHWICLSPQGKVSTDTHLRHERSVHSVDICEKGFLVADGETITLYGFSNQVARVWRERATEIVCSEVALCFVREEDATVRVEAL